MKYVILTIHNFRKNAKTHLQTAKMLPKLQMANSNPKLFQQKVAYSTW